jgi:rsbT antagonist protein RsbS
MSSNAIPIIPLGYEFLISFQGDVRDDQLSSLKQELFEKLSESTLDGVILDVSGLPTMDSFMARSLNDMAQGAKLNGVRTFLVGIQPEVAMTLVEMGLSIPDVSAERNVGDALRALRKERSSDSENR